jgi:DNA-binding MarR family transcriptional regulator
LYCHRKFSELSARIQRRRPSAAIRGEMAVICVARTGPTKSKIVPPNLILRFLKVGVKTGQTGNGRLTFNLQDGGRSITINVEAMNQYHDSGSNYPKQLAPHLGQLLHDLASDFQQRTLNKCRSRGHLKIRGAHSAILEHMDTTGMCLTELAQRVGISQQATGKLIRDLERNGYAQSHIDSRDKRSRIIRLSDRGVALLRDISEILEEVRHEYRSVLGDEAMQVFERQLKHTVQELSDRTDSNLRA